VVIEIKTINPQKRGSLRTRVLRLLGTNKDFEELSSGQEKIVHTSILGNNYQKEIKTAWLETERKKAKALIEFQKRRFIC
jgi:hypothetical protein